MKKYYITIPANPDTWSEGVIADAIYVNVEDSYELAVKRASDLAPSNGEMLIFTLLATVKLVPTVEEAKEMW